MLTKSSEYAIRCAIYVVAMSKKGHRVGVDEIASNLDAPRHFIAKILQVLTKNNVLHSAKGPNGGFYWIPKEPCVTAFDIVVLMDGPQRFTNCVLGLKACSSANPCPMHHQYKSAKEQIIHLFQTTDLEHLSNSLINQNTQLK